MSKQITIQLVVGMLFSKKTSILKYWLAKPALWKLLQKLFLEVTPESLIPYRFFYANKSQLETIIKSLST